MRVICNKRLIREKLQNDQRKSSHSVWAIVGIINSSNCLFRVDLIKKTHQLPLF